MSIVLGVHNSFTAKSHDSSATLIQDGKVVAAVEEERISRRKSSVGYPAYYAIKECLAIAGAKPNDISLVVSDGVTYPMMEEKLDNFLYSQFGIKPKVELIPQSKAHSIGTFLSSGFKSALVISVDAVGDKVSTEVSLGNLQSSSPDEMLEVIYSSDEKKSLGFFYSAFTQYLGFESLEGEYKVMGMAAYANPKVDLSHLLSFDPGVGDIKSKLSSFYNPLQTSITEYCADFNEIFKETRIKRRIPGDTFLQEHFQLASSVQFTFKEAYIGLIKYWLKKTNSKFLCLSGGCALNALANMELLDLDLEGIYVMPASSDRGVSMGCAYWGSTRLGEKTSPPLNMFLGRSFLNQQIERELKGCGVKYVTTNSPIEEAAKDLEQGLIVGWVQGRSEFGPRALGNRSILANPRLKGVKEKLNLKIKFREEFRPFAPAIDFESFQHPKKHKADLSSMTITLKVGEGQSKKFKGGVHEDSTSRVQLVSKKEDLFHKLILEVGKLSGHPSLINTSFNLRGEPIVDSPSDALRTFFSSGLDTLYIGDFKIFK